MDSSTKKITFFSAVVAAIVIIAVLWVMGFLTPEKSSSTARSVRYSDGRFGFSFICPIGTAVVHLDTGAQCSGTDAGMWIGAVSVQTTTAKSVEDWLKSGGRVATAGERMMGKRTVDGLEGVVVYAWDSEQVTFDERSAQKYWYVLYDGKIYSVAYRAYALGFDDFLAGVKFKR